MHASRWVFFMHAAGCACLCSTATHLLALAYSCTHSADPTSALAACSGHCGSTHLLPHTHAKWATAGQSSLYYSPRSGCLFILITSELCRLHIHKHSVFHSNAWLNKSIIYFSPLFTVLSMLLKPFICTQKHLLFVPACCISLGIEKNGKNQTNNPNFQSDFRRYHFPA